MRPWTAEYAGRVEEHVISSEALKGNPLGDPSTRPIWIYLPPGYDDEPERRYPVIYFLQGFGGSLQHLSDRPAFGWTTPELIDGVFANRSAPPCIVAYVDAWTKLGGSQFVDSPATGRYHTYLCEDVVSFVDENYRTLASREHRGLQGKSSGGFGAMVNAMLRPDVFSGFASHAGDTLYEHCYLPEISIAYRALRDLYHRSYNRFLAELATRSKPLRPEEFSLVMVYAVAACFSAESDGSVSLPFDCQSGELNEGVWQRWLSWDPIRMVARHRDALLSMRAIFVDAGRNDEYSFDIGAERFVQELRGVGVADLHFELFDGTHSKINHRYPIGTAYLATRLAQPASTDITPPASST